MAETPPPVVAGAQAVTEDAVLGGRVRLMQPAEGYRVAIDPVLLAAAVPAKAGEAALDIGTGVGTAALCLATRVPGLRVAGIERDRVLVRLAMRNAEINGLGHRVDVMVGDLRRPPVRLAPGTFDHVLANPPFVEAGRGSSPPLAAKAAATHEGDAGLEDWIRFALLMVRPKGSVTLIQRADRLGHVLAAFHGRLGGIVVLPLWPGPAGPGEAGARAARRVIVAGRKGSAALLRLAPGLVLHQEGGAFTPAAEAILRHGAGLDLQAEEAP